ncbi:hypothetical protein [Streptomyces sp. MMBL 11-3]|uniref:hypothetical protein n=1 Tax=Streptomyces sp. MMBL 11-3 TaxID=3382639 RepID=UPI0039B3710F
MDGITAKGGTASKTAVKVLTEGLRQESGPDLRVTLVSPPASPLPKASARELAPKQRPR